MPDSPRPRNGRARPQKGKGEPQGKGLHRKLGGLPLWGWGVGLLAAVMLGLYLRRRAGSGATTDTAAPTADQAGTGSGGGGGGLPMPPEPVASVPADQPYYDPYAGYYDPGMYDYGYTDTGTQYTATQPANTATLWPADQRTSSGFTEDGGFKPFASPQITVPGGKFGPVTLWAPISGASLASGIRRNPQWGIGRIPVHTARQAPRRHAATPHAIDHPAVRNAIYPPGAIGTRPGQLAPGTPAPRPGPVGGNNFVRSRGRVE